METTDIDDFMKRVDDTRTATELTDLQLEFQRICNSLPSEEVKPFIRAYADKIRARGRDISSRITQMESKDVTV